MMRKSILTGLCALSFCSMFAQAPEKTVEAFGDAMKDWCKTGDIDYRIKLNQLVGGENGTKKCLVDDKIMDWIAANDDKGLIPMTGTRELASYLNGFEEKLVSNTTFRMSNFKWDKTFTVPDALGGSRDDSPLYFVTADIATNGALNISDNDRFFVRGGLITKIMSTGGDNSIEKALQLFNKRKNEEAFKLFRKIAYADPNNQDAQYYLATMEILKRGTSGLNKNIRDTEACYWILRGKEKGNADMEQLYMRYMDKKAPCYYRLNFYDMLGDMQIPSNGLIPFKGKSGKWGYKNEDGNVVIDEMYDKAFPFNTASLACVQKGNKYFYINKDNEKQCPGFDFLLFYSFNGRFYGENDGALEVYNSNWELLKTYENYHLINAAKYPLKDYLMVTNSRGKVVLFDKDGNLGNDELTQKFDVKVQSIKLSNGESYDFAEWPDIVMP